MGRNRGKIQILFCIVKPRLPLFLTTLICLRAEPSRLTIFKLFNYPDRLLAIRYALIKREQGELCYLVPAHLIGHDWLLDRQEYIWQSHLCSCHSPLISGSPS